MDMTDLQRRWWFANHPEFSGARKTALANERLRLALGHPAADPDTYDKYEDVLDRIWNFGKQQPNGFRENWGLFLWRARQDGLTEEQARALWNQHEWTKQIYESANNPLIAIGLGVSGGIRAAAALRNALARRAAAAAEAAGESRIGSLWDRFARSSNPQVESAGPGKWVEVARSRYGLDHQSKMSGQAIREEAGKHFIKEYEVNGVKFDDYKDGILYDYKAPRYTNFINQKGEFHDWFRGAKEARDRALAQTGAADGIPVVWKVGRDQVQAFRTAVGKLRGITIEP